MRKNFAGLVISSLSLLILLTATDSRAHHPSATSGTGQSGPIRTVSAETLPQGNWFLSFRAEYLDLDSFTDNELMAHAAGGTDVHSVDSIMHTSLGLGYGVTDDLTLSLTIPYIHLANIRESHSDEPDEVHLHGDSNGFGDLTLSGQYRFLNSREQGLQSSLTFGIKTPTGRTTEKDIEGERFETEFQPGSGSWDPIVGLSVSKRLSSFSLDADVQCTFATEGAQDVNLGDKLDYDLALSYRIPGQRLSWDLVVELNGEWKGKQEQGGTKDPNSGGNSVFLSPGLRATGEAGWSVFLSVGFPVVQNLNGVQNEVNTRTTFGISYMF
ncbi:MAG: transporter [Thermodesulfovibrionales bacterium]|jgi:hypothetical protein